MRKHGSAQHVNWVGHFKGSGTMAVQRIPGEQTALDQKLNVFCQFLKCIPDQVSVVCFCESFIVIYVCIENMLDPENSAIGMF